ncbi:PIN domain-containing protein [Mesorhizobium sp. M8A.F.Ca.ET.213.01.1.1]|uniref:PIN domain-containing protein n=1 Tax=Mesorhizobium sp. M8A.F.Ca.ET.213.01.1.1 TaxID=2563970 RepID=UPI00387EB2AC
MPILTFERQEIDLPRNIALLDTNVLVAYMDDRDNYHEQAVLVVDELPDYIWVVTLPVIVEACGLLGRRRDHLVVIQLLQWLLSPGNVWILPSSHPSLSPEQSLWLHSDWMRRHVVDYVDSYLMEIADAITKRLELRPHLPIVTFDTSDFLRCAGSGRRYSLYDMRDLQFVDFELN